MLMAGTKAMSESYANSNSPSVNTKCHFFINPNFNDAQYFVNSKGTLPASNYSMGNAMGIPSETRSLEIPQGIKRVYFCINNDNSQTAAQATLSIYVLKK
jgi:hypothetical protein